MTVRDARGVVSSLVIALSLGCGSPPKSPAPPAQKPTPAAMAVDTATVTLPQSFPTQLYVEHDAVVAARSTGMIDSIAVDIGARVRAGQLLARIESADQELALAGAEASLDHSARTLARALALSRMQGMTSADSEQIEFQHREAVLAQRKAKRELELTRISAPFAGVIVARYVGAMRLVAAGDTLFRVAEAEPLLARIRMPEAAAAAIRVGNHAQVLAAGGASAGVATVARIGPAVDPASGTREVILRLARTGRALPGAAVTVHIGSERRLVLTVPRRAIAPDGYVLVTDGTRTTVRAVVLGRDLGDGLVEVVSGLRRGERLAPPTP
ncbi:MAG: efflux RND transporter periplasmic adaptor subunit [Gemmatimonadota bacterium]